MGVEELDDTIRLLRRGSNADLKEKCLRQEWEECLEEEKGMVMRYAHDDSFWREVKEMAQREMQLEVCIMGEQQFRKMFRDFDADGSGSIDVGELKVLLQDALNLTCTDDEVREMMRTVDADGSGEIDEDEFIEIMNAARKQQVESGRIGREPSPRRPSRVPKPQSRSPVQPQQQGYSRPAQIELDLLRAGAPQRRSSPSPLPTYRVSIRLPRSQPGPPASRRCRLRWVCGWATARRRRSGRTTRPRRPVRDSSQRTARRLQHPPPLPSRWRCHRGSPRPRQRRRGLPHCRRPAYPNSRRARRKAAAETARCRRG
eukprot:TRINITY_DN20701_c0_g1_i2.p1 TRINITY_DN20701_c0_g1~~TRINITY_DN20701_c0_g1_i2.p1  ORF type:complete len:343 (+),score=70.05 TRINITY_DN20701_c0_g1_i2:87-1031(+)